MLNHILVPLDGSSLAECTLPHLMAVARSGAAEMDETTASAPRVTLLRVLDPQRGGISNSQPLDAFDWQLRKVEAEAYLNRVSGQLAQAGLAVETAVLEGRAAETVIEFAQAQSCDLILLSSHGQSGLSEWNVSSVVQKIILRARTSVMIVRAYQQLPADPDGFCYRRILLPLDGAGRAEAAIPLATALAKAHQATLVVAHVVHEPELPRRTPPTQEDLQLAARLVERNRVEAESYLDELRGRLGVPSEMHVVVERSISDTLQRMVESENIDLVVLSAHGYSGGTRIPYGSVGLSFIAYGTSPLLVVQDVAANRLELSAAELVAREWKGR